MTNIFFVDEDPEHCVSVLSDQHVRTQGFEVAAVLAASLRRRYGVLGPLFRGSTDLSVAESDPAADWATQQWDHFMWLVFYGLALTEEHERRFGVITRASAVILAAGNLGQLLHDSEPRIPALWPSSEAALEYIDQYDYTPFNAYQNVLRDIYEGWADHDMCATWTNTYPPNWLSDVGEVLHTD
jgi:hypothetical protein